MTAGPRPNLGGLFNGSTPPERSSSISDAFGPRFVKQLPADGQVRDAPPAAERGVGSTSSDVPESAPETKGPTGLSDRWNILSWVDPTKIVVQYFAFLQVLLDTNRDLAVALTSSVMSLPRRGRTHKL